MNAFNIRTKYILGILSICELFVTHEMPFSFILWCCYGIHKSIETI